MSTVGRFFFSKLVLPAIAVQAKETDIEQNNKQTASISQSTEKLGLGTTGTAHDAAPAFRSPHSHVIDDPLLHELMAFRAWQRHQSRHHLSPHSPNVHHTSPLHHGIDGMRQRPGSVTRPITAPHSPHIIVIAGSTTHLEPSNLSVTNEPSLAPPAELNQQSHHQPIVTTAERADMSSPTGLAIIDEEKPDEFLERHKKTNSPHVTMNIDEHLNKSPVGGDIANEHAVPIDTPNTVEHTSIVQSKEDGKIIDKFVTTNVTYSNNELYIAASQFYHRLLAEFLGTWAVTFFIAGLGIEASLGHIDQVGVAIGSGLIFVALIYSLGQVSGAHFNPVVTFAFVLRGMFPLTWLPFYWIVQFTGSLVGAAMLLGFYRESRGEAGATIVPSARSEESSFFMETVLTFVLVFTILSMASRSKIVGPHAALAIGSVIALNIMLAGSYSGASMNPFRSVSISIAFPVTVYSLWVFFAGPFFGSFVAVIVVFMLAGRPRNEELTAGIGATIAVAISNQLSRDVESDDEVIVK